MVNHITITGSNRNSGTAHNLLASRENIELYSIKPQTQDVFKINPCFHNPGHAQGLFQLKQERLFFCVNAQVLRRRLTMFAVYLFLVVPQAVEFQAFVLA